MLADREKLLGAAKSFCHAFAEKKPLDEIISHFSESDEAVAIEHGDMRLTHFLGRYYHGLSGIREYFEGISVLAYDDMHFDDYIVDTDTCKVSVIGRARFTWKDRESWQEVFTYRLSFDADYRVLSYVVWADTGAAYLASQGKLEDLRRGS